MTTKKDYYKILEIDRNSSPDEIRKAYKKLVFKYHPDKNPENPEESEKKFKEISEAYSVLSNPSKKSDYDSFGRTNFQNFDYNNFDPFSFLNEYFKNNGDGEFEEFANYNYNFNNNEEKPQNDAERRFDEVRKRLRNMNMDSGFTKNNYEKHYEDDGFTDDFFSNIGNNGFPGFGNFGYDEE